MKKNIFFEIVALSILLFSCTEVIDVDLRNIEPEWVVVGEIAEGLPAKVTLTESVNFDEDNVFPSIPGMSIQLENNQGESETLNEVAPGVYESSLIKGLSGITYHLSVQGSGKLITASESIPAKIVIDSVQLTDLGFSRPPVPGSNNPNPSLVTLYFSDPAFENNYYKAIAYKSDSLVNTNTTDDLLFDGRTGQISIFIPEGTFMPGENINLQLQSIPSRVYDYYLSMPNAGQGPGSGSPANPITNLSGNKLGYFNAYSFSNTSLIFE